MHYLQKFKSFSDTKIELLNPLTVLIGPNGSGKSNLIEGIELFSFIAHGGALHEVSGYNNGGKIAVRGGLQSCPRYDNDFFSFNFSASTLFEGKSISLFYGITIQVKPQVQVFFERLAYDSKKIFSTPPISTNSSSSDIFVEYNNFSRGGRKPRVRVSSSRSVLSQYKDFAHEKNKNFNNCSQLVNSLMEHLRSSYIFDPNPKLMRNYERIGNDKLQKTGANLSAVLYGLSKGNDDEKETLKRMLSSIKYLPSEPYRDIIFVKTDFNDVIFGFKENNNTIAANLLSDGTLRCLAVLTALETVDEGSRIIIEEFDNGLHPSRVHVLTEAIASCCERRNLNVLVTTHNPATLNQLSSEQMNGVVLSVWSEEKDSFDLVRLSDVPRHDELLERGQLGDLVSDRIIDQYLLPKFEEDRKEEAMEWLRSLSNE